MERHESTLTPSAISRRRGRGRGGRPSTQQQQQQQLHQHSQASPSLTTSALPLIREVTPQEDQDPPSASSSSLSSIATAVAVAVATPCSTESHSAAAAGTALDASGSVPMASDLGYAYQSQHYLQQEQEQHMKQFRFDETAASSSHPAMDMATPITKALTNKTKPSSTKAVAASAAASASTSTSPGIPTSHCGVSKRGRYVSPGHRALVNTKTTSTSVRTGSGAATSSSASTSVARLHPSSKESQGKLAQDTSGSFKNPATVTDGINNTNTTTTTKDVPPMSPKSSEPKSFIATTPTDFTTDFGTTPSKSSAFDTSNVLAWLSSPSHMFSPGFASPNAKGNSSKTSTPIVSTSFFFSDVANLPKGGGDSSIICISPLANTKMTPGESWKEVFASPSTQIPGKTVTSSRSSPKGMDAVLAERDVRDDEDLSVLLQLASNSTPQSAATATAAPARKHHLHDTRSSSDPPPFPTMQDSAKVRLFQKKPQRSDTATATSSPSATTTSSSSSTFKLPSLGMRTNSKNGTNQAFPFQPSSDYCGSMRISIGGGKGPPSPKQPPQQPFPYQMFAAHYQRSDVAPYTFPASAYADQPPAPVQAPPAPRPRKKPRQDSVTDEAFEPTLSPLSKTAAGTTPPAKRKRSPNKKKNKSPKVTEDGERKKAAAAIQDLNVAAGGKNDKAAALAAAILRGVTQRPSGKWQAQLYFAGKSRYIGVFDSREKAALAYEIAREKLKIGAATAESTDALVNEARKAAFDGVNEQLEK